MPTRDEFPQGVKKTVAERAAYFCSRPECRQLTVGPHSDPNKSANKGVAAHIRAAAEGGPRFDLNQNVNERKGIDNAIWLCHSCSDLVDRDEKRFHADLLEAWKSEHEHLIAQDGELPLLPDITLRSKHGLTLPNDGPFEILSTDIAKLREHTLEIKNGTQWSVKHLSCRIQFPEPITYYEILERPAGVSVECRPDRMELTVVGTGIASVRVTGPLRYALDYKLDIDQLPVSRHIKVRFYSQVDEKNRTSMAVNPVALEHHILGECQYQLLGTDQRRKFLVPLSFDSEKRLIASEPAEDDDGTRVISVRQNWP